MLTICVSAQNDTDWKRARGNHNQTHLWLAELFQVRGNRRRDPHQTTSICWHGTYGQAAEMTDQATLTFSVTLLSPWFCMMAAGRVVRSRPPSTWRTGEPAARFAFVERAVMGPAARWSRQTSALIDSNRRNSESEHPAARRCFVALAIGIRELKQGWIAKGSGRSERIIAQLCVNGVCGQFKYRMYCATH